jgi:hypothetical protein
MLKNSAGEKSPVCVGRAERAALVATAEIVTPGDHFNVELVLGADGRIPGQVANPAKTLVEGEFWLLKIPRRERHRFVQFLCGLYRLGFSGGGSIEAAQPTSPGVEADFASIGKGQKQEVFRCLRVHVKFAGLTVAGQSASEHSGKSRRRVSWRPGCLPNQRDKATPHGRLQTFSANQSDSTGAGYFLPN